MATNAPAFRPANLRRERLNRGLSEEELAAEIGVSRQVLRGIEEGRRPHPGNARRVADYFECRVTDIWPLDDEEPVAA